MDVEVQVAASKSPGVPAETADAVRAAATSAPSPCGARTPGARASRPVRTRPRLRSVGGLFLMSEVSWVRGAYVKHACLNVKHALLTRIRVCPQNFMFFKVLPLFPRPNFAASL
jgi:hypothetical protein